MYRFNFVSVEASVFHKYILFILVVLKKLVASDEVVTMVMKVKVNSVSVMSVLKKLIIHKDKEYQSGAITVLSTIVNKRAGEFCGALLESDLVGRPISIYTN